MRPGVYTADWAETPHGRDFVMAMTKTHTILEERERPTSPHAPDFAATLVLAWPDGHDEVFPGSNARTGSGRCAASRGTAMIQCFNLTAMTSPSPKWTPIKKTQSATVPMRLAS